MTKKNIKNVKKKSGIIHFFIMAGIGIIVILTVFVALRLHAIAPFIGLAISIFSLDTFRYVFGSEEERKNFKVALPGKTLTASIKLFGNLLLVASMISNVWHFFFPIPKDASLIEALEGSLLSTVVAVSSTLLIFAFLNGIYEKKKSVWYEKKA